MDQQQKARQALAHYFGEIYADIRDDLDPVVEYRSLHAGEVLFERGDEANDMYFLLLGKLRATGSNDSGKTIVLGDILHGESVGEMGLLNNGKRNATVTAMRHSLVAHIGRESFEKLYSKHPEVLLRTSQTVIDRLNLANERAGGGSVQEDKVISLIDATNDSTCTTFTDQMLDHMCKDGSTVHLNESDKNELESLISAQEREYPFIALRGNDPEWISEAVSLSDSLVFICREHDLETFLELKEKLGISDAQWALADRQLVLVYEGDEHPHEVSQWFKHFDPEQILKARELNRKDVDRASRMIRDRGIGLVLGGGGAHGFAHLGVIKALEERDIPIDFVCGSSVGAIMGAGVAMDWPMDEIMSKVRTEISEDNPLNDYTVPMIALLKGERMLMKLKKHFDQNIEQTWVNFMCIASDYQNGQIQLLDTGSMYKSISASISIPGVLPPSILNDHFVLDGGVLDNVPVGSLRKKFKGRIVTSDLSVIKEYNVQDERLPSGTKVFLNRLNPFAKKLRTPRLMNVIMKSMTLGSINRKEQNKSMSDLYINSQVQKGFLAWKEFDAIVDAGYKRAREILDESEFKVQ